MFGKKHSKEIRKIIGEKSRNRSPESNRKISEFRKGKLLSEETKQRMRDSHTRRRLLKQNLSLSI